MKTILKIPENKFTVDVEKEFLSNLIECAIEKANGTGNLASILIKKYNLKKYSQRGLADNLRKWQRKRHNPFLDSYLKIGSYAKIKKEILYSKVRSIKLPRGKVSLKTKFPINLNEAWTFVSESIRVEGNLSKNKKRIIFENTDMNLIQKFKKESKKIGVQKFRQDLRIKVMIPIKNKLSEIKIINTKTNEKKRAYKRILKLKKENKKEIIFIENNVNIGDSFDYLIELKSDKFKVHVDIPTSGKIKATSTLETNLSYQKVTPSFVIVIGNTTFHHILNKNFQIQTGKKSRKIFIPEPIKQLPKDTLKGLINATLAAESTVAPASIKITSLSKNYIKDLEDLFKKFNITSIIDKKRTTISIYGNRNFQKIKKNFNFIISYKNKQLNELLNITTQHSPKGLAKSLYLKSLFELNIASAIEIRNRTGRIGNSFRQYINELLAKNYIESITNIRPKKYKLTKTGKKYLENNKTYWLD